MRRYRIGRPLRACDEFDDFNPTNGYGHGPLVECSEGEWEQIGILGPTGEPISVFVGPDPIGFLWHDEDGCLRPRHELDSPE